MVYPHLIMSAGFEHLSYSSLSSLFDTTPIQENYTLAIGMILEPALSGDDS